MITADGHSDTSEDRPARRVTDLLTAWSNGDRSALDAVIPLVHDDLKRLARRFMAHERTGHTLQPTALVHEAYVRLVGERAMQWQNRAHFLAVAAQLMRFILVDAARRRRIPRRGGDLRRVTLGDAMAVADDSHAGVLALDQALSSLGKIDERKARVAEMRLFGGASVQESAEALDVSAVTVMRDWRFAKAWLQRELEA
ncbi:MAG TPA: ECF-type sigma factor [Vicinamibacterales bacterium]|jgi:RNA polymerase sigma factor (TIGR02999 family)|nr:ECF-type sigma factor [Vicinamibacterales bacterium]